MSGAIKRFIKRYKHPFNILLGRATFARPPEVLFTFTSAEDTDRWRLVTDAAFGGRSRATFTLNDDRDAAVFQGAYTVDHGGDDDELLRAGFCSVSSKVFGYGQAVNLEPFDRMVYEVKGDGHTYVANLRLQNMTGDGGDIWQAPLRTTPGAWTQVVIPFRSFVPTSKGRLIAQRSTLPRDRILSYGFAISATDNDTPDADFRLEVREIRADRDTSKRLV